MLHPEIWKVFKRFCSIINYVRPKQGAKLRTWTSQFLELLEEVPCLFGVFFFVCVCFRPAGTFFYLLYQGRYSPSTSGIRRGTRTGFDWPGPLPRAMVPTPLLICSPTALNDPISGWSDPIRPLQDTARDHGVIPETADAMLNRVKRTLHACRIKETVQKRHR